MNPTPPSTGEASAADSVAMEGMHAPERSLLATIEGQSVGTLQEHRNLWRFEYTTAWRDTPDGFDLSPWLPRRDARIVDGSTSRPVQWYFDNLLPEEHLRVRIATEANIAGNDDFALLAHDGAESAGSLTLLPPGKTLAPGTRVPLSDAELSRRIGKLPRFSLSSGAEKRMSLAGAQHKLAVIEDDGLYQPVGDAASTHILKPDSSDPDYPHTVINEWFTLRLARAMGLATPDVQRRYVPEPVFLIARFDREVTGDGVRRLHAIDGCQLLNLPRSAKYASATVQNLAAIVEHCREKLSARRRLFDWLVFNVLTGNDDAHLKNLSFSVGKDGIDLAPHYDLLSTVAGSTRAHKQEHAAWPQASTVAGDIMGVKRFADITPEVLIEAAVALKLPARMAQRRVATMAATIVGEAEALYAAVEQENQQWASVAGVTLEGEMRMLRTIIHVVIKHMAAQLQAPTPA